MCLSTRTETLVPNDTPVTAWKVFRKNREEFHLQYYSFEPKEQNLIIEKPWETRIETGVWLQAQSRMTSDDGYMSGFHVFIRKEDAIEWADWCDGTKAKTHNLVVKEVKVRKIRISGIQRDMVVLVADEMLVEADHVS